MYLQWLQNHQEVNTPNKCLQIKTKIVKKKRVYLFYISISGK